MHEYTQVEETKRNKKDHNTTTHQEHTKKTTEKQVLQLKHVFDENGVKKNYDTPQLYNEGCLCVSASVIMKSITSLFSEQPFTIIKS